ncbi:TetR/AcrR family transcriptional regulator [Nonomuraea guangzhouensis]|uniref:TetR/AcrR family transcriptional regulator n=1 Tax=Nonomuraea guangzhouensis TaxID=1291555 RepID=A0ABW4G8K6_9ACTN|nr:TetR/AcrR family transcriptional regulator [Nonomuraea guangzhouensis]
MTKTDQVPGTRRKGSQTRADIQEAALSLFTERGYDATSMREIAEQLGITKAALYYHFDSKEAVIRSLFTDHLRALDELLDWAAEQPHSPQLASELLGRWLTQSGQRGLKTMRFVAANHTALKSAVPPGKGGAMERIDQATRIILGPDAPLQDQLRVRMALLSMHSTVLAAQGTKAGNADILTAAIRAATLLVSDLVPVPETPIVD